MRDALHTVRRPVQFVTLGLALLGVTAASAPRSARANGIRIEGNVVLPEEVYLAFVDWTMGDLTGPGRNRSALAEAEAPQRIAARVQDFLHRSGYELALVEAIVEENGLLLRIDEGRLDKVVLKGPATLIAISVQLALSVPNNVYNRPAIARQVQALALQYGYENPWIELVPVEDKEHRGPQIVSFGTIRGEPTIPPPGKYELHIYLGYKHWDRGLGLHIGIGQADGLLLGASLSDGDLMLDDDRWTVQGNFAAKRYQSLVNAPDEVRLSRLVLFGRYFSPGLFGVGLRPFIEGGADLQGRQRADLAVESFFWLRAHAMLSLGVDIDSGFLLSIGGGIEHRNLFFVEMARDTTAPNVDPFAQTRGVGSGRAEIVFDTHEARFDRRHQLILEQRTYFGGLDAKYDLGAVFSWQYRKIFEFGWHDLVVGTAGGVIGGDLSLVDELAVGDYLRGVFSDQYWVKRLGAATLEFRFSLTRDLFKIGGYTDIALFDQPVPRGGSRLRVANSSGIGFHSLILDLVQVDVYYGWGFASDGRSDDGFSARVVKAF